MILFVDASALVAMMLKESDALEIADQMDFATELIWSPMSCWETVVSLAKQRKWDVSVALGEVYSFGREYGLRSVPIGDREYFVAIEAHRIYGRRSEHPAKLNMGDCFAYACAKTNGARLLYKGSDFVHTDLA